MSDMEINILSKEVIEQLEERAIHVDRAYSGRSVTSQEMPGFSITILHVNDEMKRILGSRQFDIQLYHVNIRRIDASTQLIISTLNSLP